MGGHSLGQLWDSAPRAGGVSQIAVAPRRKGRCGGGECHHNPGQAGGGLTASGQLWAKTSNPRSPIRIPPKQAQLQGPHPRPRRRGKAQDRRGTPSRAGGRTGGSDLLARQVVKVPGPSPLDAVTDCPGLDPRPRPPDAPSDSPGTHHVSERPGHVSRRTGPVCFLRPPRLTSCSLARQPPPPTSSPPAAPPRFAQVLGSSPGLTAAGPGVPGGGRNRRSQIQESGLQIAPGRGPPCLPEGPPVPRD